MTLLVNACEASLVIKKTLDAGLIKIADPDPDPDPDHPRAG
ncbi:hypothetical protein [Methylotuvimicrobium sp. KM2]